MKRLLFVLSFFCCLSIAKSQDTTTTEAPKRIMLSSIIIDRDDNDRISSYTFLWRIDTLGIGAFTNSLGPQDSTLTSRQRMLIAFAGMKQTIINLYLERQKIERRILRRTVIPVDSVVTIN